MKKKLKLRTNKTSVENAIMELHELRQKRNLLEKRETELKEKINDYITKNTTPDSKGSYSYYVDNGISKIFYQRQARKKISLNNDSAIRILRKKRLIEAIIHEDIIAEEVTNDQIIEALLESGYEEYIDNIQKVDESALEQLLLDGKITEEEFEQMCSIDTKYAVYCREVEEDEIIE